MAKGTIGVLPGYASALRNFKPTPATVKALAPTQAAKNVLGVSWGGTPGSLDALAGQSNAASGLNYKPPASTGVPASSITTVRTPNEVYEGDILSAPESQSGLTRYNTTLDTGMQQLRDAIGGQVVNSGWDPGAMMASSPGLAGYANLVSQATRDQAAANPLSQKAQLQKSLSESLYNLPYQLNATGSARSGASNINATKFNQQYDVQSQQAINDLLAAIKGNVGDYTTLASNAASALDQARAAAAARLASQMGYSETTTQAGGDTGDTGGGGGGGSGTLGGGAYSPAAVTRALNQPGAVGAMGGPAAWANAMTSVKPKTATTIKKLKSAMLVGRDY